MSVASVSGVLNRLTGRAFPGPDAAIDTIAQFDAAAAFLFPVMQIDG